MRFKAKRIGQLIAIFIIINFFPIGFCDQNSYKDIWTPLLGNGTLQFFIRWENINSKIVWYRTLINSTTKLPIKLPFSYFFSRELTKTEKDNIEYRLIITQKIKTYSDFTINDCYCYDGLQQYFTSKDGSLKISEIDNIPETDINSISNNSGKQHTANILYTPSSCLKSWYFIDSIDVTFEVYYQDGSNQPKDIAGDKVNEDGLVVTNAAKTFKHNQNHTYTNADLVDASVTLLDRFKIEDDQDIKNGMAKPAKFTKTYSFVKILNIYSFFPTFEIFFLEILI